MVKSKGMVEAGDVKVSIKPFDGKDDFTLWQRKMKNVLIQQETDEAIGTKPTSMSDAKWTKKNKKAKSSASHCEGAQDLVKDSDDVFAAQSALPQEVNEPPSAVKTVELISLTLSSTPTKSPASKISDVNVAATTIEPEEAPKTEALGDYNGKFDFESGSSTEGDSEDEGTEDESVDEASSELQDNMNDIREASEEEDSDDESTKGESSEEEEYDDDITEEESSEDEAVADKSEKPSAQKSLIVENADANMSEAVVVAKEDSFTMMNQTSSP
uniref:sperm protein associated with the nucleus on the X chromosome N2-like n=1 Tax=Fragaria vesca subsp. vesca TaxID=101020 RepID=UPI0005C85D9E|nr:PREDICTED: sperm protein associated with the nucleus on the X chromosome N2-like [Fragaria vesca subsp. vesca]